MSRSGKFWRYAPRPDWSTLVWLPCAAAATHHATRTYEQIAKETPDEAARIDAAEAELHGEALGTLVARRRRGVGAIWMAAGATIALT